MMQRDVDKIAVFDLIIPAVREDVYVLLSNLNWIRKFIDYDRMIVIGDDRVKTALDGASEDIVYLDENGLIPKDAVRSLMSELADGDGDCVSRTGWYYQQFLKMKYADICNKDCYLVWDSDTIPLHKVKMIKGEKPVFDIKKEYNPPYFETIYSILGLKRVGRYSFISEHMLFSSAIMREMTECIEKRNRSKGSSFWEIILRSVPAGELKYSGFSEYETYGTYCMNLHPGEYILRRWHSTRNGGWYFDHDRFGADEAAWLRPRYDAVSFEKATGRKHGSYPGHAEWIRKHISPGLLIGVTDALWTVRFSRHRIEIAVKGITKRLRK